MWAHCRRFNNNWICWLLNGNSGSSQVFWSSILLCLQMPWHNQPIDVLWCLVLSCERKHLLTIPYQGWRQGEVQIPLTPGRLVRKFSDVQSRELLAELLPRGAPIFSIAIGSGLQRLGASVASDLPGWPDTSFPWDGGGRWDWNYFPNFIPQIWARALTGRCPQIKQHLSCPLVTLVTEGAGFRKLVSHTLGLALIVTEILPHTHLSVNTALL